MVTKSEDRWIRFEQERAERPAAARVLPHRDPRRPWWSLLAWFRWRRAAAPLLLCERTDEEINAIVEKVCDIWSPRKQSAVIAGLLNHVSIYRLCRHIVEINERHQIERERWAASVDRWAQEVDQLSKEMTDLQVEREVLQVKCEQLLMKGLGLPTPNGDVPSGVIDLLSPGCKSPAEGGRS